MTAQLVLFEWLCTRIFSTNLKVTFELEPAQRNKQYNLKVPLNSFSVMVTH